MTALALPMAKPLNASSSLALPSTGMKAPTPEDDADGEADPEWKEVEADGDRGGPDDAEGEADGEADVESEDEEEVGKKKAAGKGPKRRGGAAGGVGDGYKYLAEIGQMMFVFGEVQDPLAETVKLVEDIVRGQIIEIVTRARLLTHLRNSRYLSAEDLIFLIRDDTRRVNRLRLFLSWKDIRRKAKEDNGGDTMGDDGVEMDDADKAAKTRKTMVKLPWDVLTPFNDVLKTLPHRQGREDEDEEDDDEMQAYQDSMQRLRDADEITKKMTKDEYVHYSDCRQASFTYRKAKRFRDFVNFPAYLDVRPNDEVVDVLGFLSFEMVRSLCVAALAVRDRMERSRAPAPAPAPSQPAQPAQPTPVLPRRRSIKALTSTAGAPGSAAPSAAGSVVGAKRRLTASTPGPGSVAGRESESPQKRPKGLFASPETTTSSLPDTSGPSVAPGQGQSQSGKDDASARKRQPHALSQTQRREHRPVSLFAPPPSARQPLLPSHVMEAYATIQRQSARSKAQALGHFRSGAAGCRRRVALV